MEALNFTSEFLPGIPSEYARPTIQRLFLNTQKQASVSVLLASIGLWWAVWRFWRFTLYPMLHPDEPKELPYLIPSKYLPHTKNKNSC